MALGLSTAAVLLIAAGFWLRRQRAWHIAFMVAALTLDLTVLVLVEITRHAVAQTIAGPRPLLGVHIAASIGMLAAYAVMLGLGVRLLGGAPAVRAGHRRAGVAFALFRGLNYVTSFLV